MKYGYGVTTIVDENGDDAYHAVIFDPQIVVWTCEHKHRVYDDAKDCAKDLQKDYNTPCTTRPYCTSPGCGCWRKKELSK